MPAFELGDFVRVPRMNHWCVPVKILGERCTPRSSPPVCQMNREIAKVSAHHALTAATLKDVQFTSSAIPMPALCRRHTRDGAEQTTPTAPRSASGQTIVNILRSAPMRHKDLGPGTTTRRQVEMVRPVCYALRLARPPAMCLPLCMVRVKNRCTRTRTGSCES
jgi:hypothetical protein